MTAVQGDRDKDAEVRRRWQASVYLVLCGAGKALMGRPRHAVMYDGHCLLLLRFTKTLLRHRRLVHEVLLQPSLHSTDWD